MTQDELNKSTVISNIQEMERKIGATVSSYDFLVKKTYDELHEQQNSTIEHYNQAIKNGNNKKY